MAPAGRLRSLAAALQQEVSVPSASAPLKGGLGGGFRLHQGRRPIQVAALPSARRKNDPVFLAASPRVYDFVQTTAGMEFVTLEGIIQHRVAAGRRRPLASIDRNRSQHGETQQQSSQPSVPALSVVDQNRLQQQPLAQNETQQQYSPRNGQQNYREQQRYHQTIRSVPTNLRVQQTRVQHGVYHLDPTYREPQEQLNRGSFLPVPANTPSVGERIGRIEEFHSAGQDGHAAEPPQNSPRVPLLASSPERTADTMAEINATHSELSRESQLAHPGAGITGSLLDRLGSGRHGSGLNYAQLSARAGERTPRFRPTC